jgi:hypothetical protein
MGVEGFIEFLLQFSWVEIVIMIGGIFIMLLGVLLQELIDTKKRKKYKKDYRFLEKLIVRYDPIGELEEGLIPGEEHYMALEKILKEIKKCKSKEALYDLIGSEFSLFGEIDSQNCKKLTNRVWHSYFFKDKI